MKFTVVTMTRGDAHKIGEWVNYHARLGFLDFHIVLDGDIDGTREVLRDLDTSARLTLHVREEVGEYYDDRIPARDMPVSSPGEQCTKQSWRRDGCVGWMPWPGGNTCTSLRS